MGTTARVVQREPRRRVVVALQTLDADARTNLNTLLATCLSEAVYENVEAAHDVTELLARQESGAGLCPQEHLVPEPDHRNLFSARAELRAQLWSPDALKRTLADRP